MIELLRCQHQAELIAGFLLLAAGLRVNAREMLKAIDKRSPNELAWSCGWLLLAAWYFARLMS